MKIIETISIRYCNNQLFYITSYIIYRYHMTRWHHYITQEPNFSYRILLNAQCVTHCKRWILSRLRPALAVVRVIGVITMVVWRLNSVLLRKAACIGLTPPTISRRFVLRESSRTYLSAQHSSNLRIHQKLWLQVICNEAAGCVVVVAFVVHCCCCCSISTWRNCFEKKYHCDHH